MFFRLEDAPLKEADICNNIIEMFELLVPDGICRDFNVKEMGLEKGNGFVMSLCMEYMPGVGSMVRVVGLGS